jgi:hypothetical protein
VRLVFLGDVAVDRPFGAEAAHPAFAAADLVLANLEGALATADEARAHSAGAALPVYNDPAALEVLRAYRVGAAYLANNHLHDLALPAAHTRERLAAAGVAAFGAGADLAEAAAPLVFAGEGATLVASAFGWDVIGCRWAGPGREGVNPLRPAHALREAERLRAAHPDAFVAFVMHWNYELEAWPQPAERQLAHDLVRAGVDAVVGMHPHVAQGAELVEGKPVAYGLGNWFFPPRQSGGIRLAFPPRTFRQLALELVVEGRRTRETRFHWHRFDPETAAVEPEATEGWDGEILRGLTPFAGMGHAEYVRWFRAHRRRRRGLPVYADHRHGAANRARDAFVKSRQRLIELLLRLRLKGGPRDYT